MVTQSAQKPAPKIELAAQLSPEQRRWVWQLLQSTSREADSPYAIEQEYPIVLGEGMTDASICLTKAPCASPSDIICHSSFWPRRLQDSSGAGFEVGLIGNVATCPAWRKQGMMTRLLAAIAESAKARGLSALILWSDLTALYEKLGFVATSKEVRYFFHRQQLQERLSSEQLACAAGLEAVEPAQLSDDDLSRCLALRPELPFTLARTIAEFRQLLNIPNLNLFIHRGPSGIIDRFYFVDKGVDMPQVIHEWGVSEARSLPADIQLICEALGYDQVLLLAPSQLAKPLARICGEYALAEETHPMALVKMLSAERTQRQALATAFVWGLDGI